MFGQRTSLFVREHVAMLKLCDVYDLLEPETQLMVGQAKDEPAPWAKWLRLIAKKAMLPTTLNVYAGSDPNPLLSVRKHAALFRTRLDIVDAQGRFLAQVRSKLFSFRGAFVIFDPAGQEIGQLKGDWKGWDYTVTLQGRSVGAITKKWAGLFKEVFTSADQYLVKADAADQLPLLLGLALAVDVVYKEQRG